MSARRVTVPLLWAALIGLAGCRATPAPRPPEVLNNCAVLATEVERMRPVRAP